MKKGETYSRAAESFRAAFGRKHAVAAYAPGRVEILGNHTDYNEGFVLSAAIDYGTFFLAAPSEGARCRLVAADVSDEVCFDAHELRPFTDRSWPNYVVGMLAGMRAHGAGGKGFDGLLLGNVPLGAGLSSSASLEMAVGLAFNRLYGCAVQPLDLARIGQRAEHDYAGVRCGLLDQISSLFGRGEHLVMTDFRTLEVRTIPLTDHVCFLLCNTGVRHALVDGEYNRRREKCEEAAAFFSSVLDHPVRALRDVTFRDWEQYAQRMDPEASRRSAHPIGENERVIKGCGLLERGEIEAFGRLMYDSHRSSRDCFENSCPELDFVVDTASHIPGVLGARLSGGGFGGSAVVLLHPRDVETASHALGTAYRKRFGADCGIHSLTTSAGAHMLEV